MSTERAENQLAQDLTKRQSEVLDVIREHIAQNGAPPTRAEIAKRLGFKSVNAAEDHLKALARKGAIALFPGTSRGIQLLGQHANGLPIVNRRDPNNALLHENNIETRCKIDPELFQPAADFLMRIDNGNSMLQSGILESDLVAIHQTNQARDGQIVLVRINNDTFIRRYHRKADYIELSSDNPNIAATRYPANREDTLHIEGIAVGVIRTTRFSSREN